MTEFTTWRSLVDGEEIIGIPDSVVEDFERDDPLDDYDGDTEDYSTTSDAIQGSTSISSTGDSGEAIQLVDVVVDSLPEKGDEFSYLVEGRDDDAGPIVMWGVPDPADDDGYEVWVNIPDDEILFNDRTGSTLDSESVSLSANQVYEVVVDWQDNDDIDIEVFEFDEEEFNRGESVATLSANDDTHADNNGIAFRSQGGSSPTNVFDWVVIGPEDGQYDGDPGE